MARKKNAQAHPIVEEDYDEEARLSNNQTYIKIIFIEIKKKRIEMEKNDKKTKQNKNKTKQNK